MNNISITNSAEDVNINSDPDPGRLFKHCYPPMGLIAFIENCNMKLSAAVISNIPFQHIPRWRYCKVSAKFLAINFAARGGGRASFHAVDLHSPLFQAPKLNDQEVFYKA